MITLDAIVSVPMQSHERGIILAVIILACVIIFQRGLTCFNFKNRKLESITQGEVSLLVKDGVINYFPLDILFLKEIFI
ncbi:hypothetical protein BH23BAC1_BH23BAC1_51030 [soil metagenome]